MKKVFMPLPSWGFHLTEAAIPWKLLTERNFGVGFAIPSGDKASVDITGKAAVLSGKIAVTFGGMLTSI
jgi:hypothetical protein